MSAVTTLSRVDPTVDPGGEAAVTVKIRNSGSIVDRFDVDVVGPSAGWARVDPPSLSLFPGVEGTVTITFQPPRASTPRAGIYPFGIRVRPAADPAGSSVEEGRIAVTPFTNVAAEVVPQTSRGSRVARHQVVVDNRGNAPSEVVVTAVDPDRRLGLSVDPPRAVVPPEDRVGFRVRVEVDDPFPFGQVRPRPFQVGVEPGRQAPIQLRATMNQRPMLPGWIPPVAGVGALALLLVVGSFLAKAGPFTPNATPAPSAVAEASSAPPSGPPSAAPSSGSAAAPPSAAPASGGAGASSSPSLAPLQPKDFVLAVTGDDVELGGGLALLCPTTDKPCRREVKETVLAMVNELQNPYTGQGIQSTGSTSKPNTLPLVMTADRDIPWSQAGGGQAGVTQKVVLDLGPLLAIPATPPYAVVNTPDGIPHRFTVDAANAKGLFDRLYQLPPAMSVAPATPVPGTVITDPVFAIPVWNFPWVVGQPIITPAP